MGFNRDNILLFGIDPTQSGYKGARLADFYKRLQERIAALPGVRSATISSFLLLSGSVRISSISVQGYSPRPNEKLAVHVLLVGARFFETMAIPLILGRSLGPQDDENAPKVAVVNEALARHLFGNENPIGKRFGWGRSKTGADFEIVGVAKDAKYESLRKESPETVYAPFRQNLHSVGAMHFEVRTAGNPSAMIPAVRQVVEELDRNLPLYDVKTQTQQVDELLLQERLFAKLSSFFGALALLLACVGLYGILSYAVARRTSEIGIRMALGAQRANILGMVLRETLLLVVIGVAVGVPAALAASRLASSPMAGLLFGLKATDPVTIVFATVVMVAVAAIAGFLPARRASCPFGKAA